MNPSLWGKDTIYYIKSRQTGIDKFDNTIINQEKIGKFDIIWKNSSFAFFSSSFALPLEISSFSCYVRPKKEAKCMKNAKKLVAGLVKTVAEKELQRDANRTSCNLIYQPKVPRNLNRFKKNQK